MLLLHVTLARIDRHSFLSLQHQGQRLANEINKWHLCRCVEGSFSLHLSLSPLPHCLIFTCAVSFFLSPSVSPNHRVSFPFSLSLNLSYCFLPIFYLSVCMCVLHCSVFSLLLLSLFSLLLSRSEKVSTFTVSLFFMHPSLVHIFTFLYPFLHLSSQLLLHQTFSDFLIHMFICLSV